MLFMLLSTAFAQDAWLTDTHDLVRWPDGEPVMVKSLTDGAKVEIVFEDEELGLTRVRSGLDFGWVPSATLTTEAPEGAVPGGLLDGLNLGGGLPPGAMAPPSGLLGGN
jgi:hypothetical protein